MRTALNWRWGAAGVIAAAIAMSPMACEQHGADIALEQAALVGSGAHGAGTGAPAVANLAFTLKDMDGRDVQLAAFRGHPIVLNFWATWCGPCRLEIPHLVELASQYQSQGLVVLGISTDDDPSDLRAFAPTMKMTYPVLVGRGHEDLLEAYDAIYGIPISWFIHKDGTVALKQPGYNSKAWFEQQIRALF